MKTILHSDYWIEIPAGEFLIGLSDMQRNLIGTYVRKHVGHDQFSKTQHQLLENIIEKYRQRAERARIEGTLELSYPIELNDEEKAVRRLEPFRKIINVENALTSIPTQKSIHLDRFYIAIFTITESQYHEYRSGKPATHLSGTIERPHRGGAKMEEIEDALQLCRDLGGRLPTIFEWEKAARGTDGRLYPWGDEWNPEAGYFFRGQPMPSSGWYAALSRGVSPYGVWGMAGGLPELVTALTPQPHETRKGCHPKESSRETAWFDHIVARPGRGMWVSVRPVLDKWPRQQWQGFKPEE